MSLKTITKKDRKRLKEAFISCKQEIEAVGLNLGTITELKINTRATSRFGRSYFNSLGECRIEISALLLYPDIPDSMLKQFLIHEMLHTCPGCMEHGAIWNKNAELLNTTYGYTLQRVVPEETAKFVLSHAPGNENTADADALSAPTGLIRHKLICPNCNYTIIRQRNSSLVQHPEEFLCPNCNTPLKKVF